MKTPLIQFTLAMILAWLFAPSTMAAELIVTRITNLHTVTVGSQNYHKYNYETVSLSPDGSTAPVDSGTDYTYAITIGSSDSDAVYVNAYTSVLASAAGGYIIETLSSNTRPTPMSGAGVGGGSLFAWDSNYANDFSYSVVGQGEHNISSFAPSFKIWSIALKPHPGIALSGSMGFGRKPVKTSTKRILTIKNVGAAPLVVSGITCPAGFRVSPWTGTIASGATKTVTVTFRPLARKKYSGKIVVQSNAASGTHKLPVSGTGKRKSASLPWAG